MLFFFLRKLTMDGMSDFLVRYMSHSDSPVSSYRNPQQASSLFSPDVCDGSGGDSFNMVNEFNSDPIMNGNLFCHKKNLDECLHHLNQVTNQLCV